MTEEISLEERLKLKRNCQHSIIRRAAGSPSGQMNVYECVFKYGCNLSQRPKSEGGVLNLNEYASLWIQNAEYFVNRIWLQTELSSHLRAD